MDIRKCTENQVWEAFAKKSKNDEFLQSWDWGEFQKSTGNEVLRLQLLENGEVINQMQGIIYRLGVGINYIYFPRLVENKNWETGMKLILNFLKKKSFSFVRIEPTKELQLTTHNLQLTKNRQLATTLLLDLTKVEDELLSHMHTKTRYNIRLASRK